MAVMFEATPCIRRARWRTRRREAPGGRIVVTSEAQGERIGEAADDRRLARIGLARRLGKARFGAFRRGDQRRFVGREGDFEIGLTRQRPGARGKRLLERLIRRVSLAGWLAVGRLDVNSRHSGPYRGERYERRETFSIGLALRPRQGGATQTPVKDWTRSGRSGPSTELYRCGGRAEINGPVPPDPLGDA